jgi:hypothetical protein
VLRELDQAIEIARVKGQPNALVNAAALRAKLGGLMVERQQIEVSQPDFDPEWSVAEILQKVTREAGVKAATALAEAFGLDVSDYDLIGEAVASTSSPVASTSPRSIEWRPPRHDRKRQIS